MGRFVERWDDMLGAADRNIACGASAPHRHARKSARRVTNQKLSTLFGRRFSVSKRPFATRAIAAAHARGRVKRLLPPMDRQFFVIGRAAIRAIELLVPARVKSSHTASTEAVWKRICNQCLTVRPDARRALGD